MYKSLSLLFLMSIFACKMEKKALISNISTQGVTLNSGITEPITGLNDEKTTVFVFVRHAEKETQGDDPNLSEVGKNRAKHLAEILKNLNINRIGYSNTKRAQATAAPLLGMINCSTDVYAKTVTEPYLLSTMEACKGKAVLVVGHSNSIPEMINILVGEKKINDIPDDEFDNLYIVSVINKGNAKVMAYKY
jgi:2,3-bisphosphoglycerate-dependent phosphoglycerate mutase